MSTGAHTFLMFIIGVMLIRIPGATDLKALLKAIAVARRCEVGAWGLSLESIRPLSHWRSQLHEYALTLWNRADSAARAPSICACSTVSR